MSSFMVYVCGKIVGSSGTTLGFIPKLSTTVYARKTKAVYIGRLYAKLYTTFTQACAYVFMQFQSVICQLSPLYTVPIIRTIKG